MRSGFPHAPKLTGSPPHVYNLGSSGAEPDRTRRFVIQVPGYLIKREIGKGGMATVWLAVQASLEREVALKVMQPTLANDPNFSRRFLQEARTLASLSHPNIVAVYDVGVTDSQLHYFSMQHLPGGDFTDRIKDGLPEVEVVRVLSGIGRALAFAHHRGFIHRDVSPANVLFDASDNPILTDFGIARAVTRTSRLTNAGVSVGTSQYMSPEQARGGDVDTRSDIYSLGCVAFEGLTGKPPYQGEDGFAIAYAHVFEPVPRLPAKLARWQPLIDRALAKDPKDRYASVDEFVGMVDEIASHTDAIGGAATRPLPIVTPAAIAAAEAAAAAKPAPAPAAPANTQPVRAPMPATPPASQPQPAASAAATVMAKAPTPVPPKPSKPAPAEAPTKTTPAVVAAKSEVPAAPRPPSPAVRLALMALVILVGVGSLTALVLMGVDRWRASEPGASATPATTAPSVPPSPAPPGVEAPRSTPGDGTTVEPDGVAGIDPAAPPMDTLDAALQGIETQFDENGNPLDPMAATPEDAEALRLAVAAGATDPLALLLALGKSDLAAQRYANPPGRNALERYRLAQKLAEKFKAQRELGLAKQGQVDTAAGYADLAEKRLVENKESEFLDFLGRAEEIGASLPEGAAVVERVRARRAGLRDEALGRGRTALAGWDKAAATAAFERALVFDPGNDEAKKGLVAAKTVGDPGFRFRDRVGGQNGPELVVARVDGKRLAVARREVTLGEFQRYWQARGAKVRGADRPGCRNRESIALFGTGKARTFAKPDIAQDGSHPVVCVAWADADDYAQWLSEQSGQKYRLPSVAEWVAIARGASGVESCGGNVGDSSYGGKFKDRDAYACDDGAAETAKAGSYKAAASGVYDLVGNAREWVSDGGAGAKSHIAMGAGWTTTKDKPSPTQRTTFDDDVAANTVGFRVVRQID